MRFNIKKLQWLNLENKNIKKNYKKVSTHLIHQFVNKKHKFYVIKSLLKKFEKVNKSIINDQYIKH